MYKNSDLKREYILAEVSKLKPWQLQFLLTVIKNMTSMKKKMETKEDPDY